MERRLPGILVAVLLTMGALTGNATAGMPQPLTLSYHGPLTGSGSLDENFAGTSTFRIPSTWAAAKSKNGRYYELTPPPDDGCTFKVQVNNQPTLTKASTAAQVAAALPEGFRRAQLGRGTRPHGSWGADETSTHATATRRRIYAIGVIHLTGHLNDRFRAVATFDGSCSDDMVRNGTVALAVERIVQTGSFTGHRVQP